MLRRKSIFALTFLAFFSLGMAPKPPADTTPPQVSIIVPVNNSTLSGSVSIQVQATDNKGISKVEFYVDNALRATSYGLPYTYSWNSAAVVNGSHTLKVVAFDSSKNSKQAQVSVSVNNAVPPPPISEGEQIKVPSAFVSSYYNSSKAAAQTIDNNLSTYWEGKYRVSIFSSKTIKSWWLRLDLDKPYELSRISIWWYKGYGALDYSIQGSNDYQTWVDLQAGLSTAAANTNLYQTDHVLTGSYRYIRININKAQAPYPRIYEVKLYSAANPPSPDTTPPTGSIKINNGAQFTNSTNVILNLSAQDEAGGSGLSQMQLSSDNITWNPPEGYVTTKTWTLSAGNGLKQVFVKFKDGAGNWSQAFKAEITLRIPSPPQVGTVSPTNASSTAEAVIKFVTTYSDADGWQDIQQCLFLINNSANGLNGLLVYYDQNSGKLFLRNDADTNWLGGYAPGSANIIENNYCKLDCSQTTVQDSGSILTITWAVVFKKAFPGKLCNIYLSVKDDSGAESGWVQKGTCLVNSLYYWAILDEHDTALPSDGQYYNYIGGNRGLLNAGDISYSWDNNSSYKAKAVRNPGSWGGMWYSLGRDSRDNIPLDFKAIFGPYVKNEFQGEVTEIEIVLGSVNSPSSNSNLRLKIELKDKSENVIGTKEFSNLTATTYSWILPEEYKQNIKLILWIIDRTQINDEISVERIRLKTRVPDLTVVPTEEQAFLWTFSWLMNNYVPQTGLVQDRSNFEAGVLENVSAAAKAAKCAYYAYRKGYISQADAVGIITKIADSLTRVIPRGPSGVNTLWPHFTKNGGSLALPPHDGFAGTEWASGDTSYAALDIITALQLIDDPQAQLGALEDFLKAIKWNEIISNDGYIGHGYLYAGEKIPYFWKGFGMETLGVDWAYASATGGIAEMDSPPSDNGSGFIDNILYPVVFSGTDHWGNDWDAYRNTFADTQIGWYKVPGRNQYLTNAGIFGLSAAEIPERDAYAAYGVGGKTIPANDGDSEVFVLHYSGMISDIRPQQAKRMWEILRDRTEQFLQNTIVVSPLNNLESMRVNKNTGKCTVNYLKGSWNLALQAEGWAQADQRIREDLNAAVQNNAFLKSGFDLLKERHDQVNVWEESIVPVAIGETVSEVKALDSSIFVRTSGNLSSNYRIYKSSNFGVNWQPVNIKLLTGELNAMDIDQGKLYVASQNGIVVSDDQGASFKWSFDWGWDDCVDVDMQNGYGWAAVVSWGSMSGPIRKTPEGGWAARRGDISNGTLPTYSAVADPIDPYNIAYIRTKYNYNGIDYITNYRTLDSGEHWVPLSYTVIYATVIDGKPVIFAKNSYSQDRGNIWKSLGINAMAIIRDEGSGLFFAGTSSGIYVGRPGTWLAYGLSGQSVQSLSMCAGRLFAVTTTGHVYLITPDFAALANIYGGPDSLY